MDSKEQIIKKYLLLFKIIDLDPLTIPFLPYNRSLSIYQQIFPQVEPFDDQILHEIWNETGLEYLFGSKKNH